MAVLIDTAGLPMSERRDAYDGALNSAVFPSHVELLADVPEPHARVERWVLGVGVDVVQTVTTGHRLYRTHHQIRAAAPEQISLAMVSTGTTAVEQGIRSYKSLCAVHAIDAMSPYRATFLAPIAGPSVAMCAQIDLNRLGMPVDVVRAALPRLAASPLYELFRGHLAGLAAAAALVENTPAAALLGSATSELARALLASAVPGDRWARESLADVLCTRVDSYIRQHSTDGSLDAERIATEHSISVRYLYLLFARRGISLEQQIIRERLEHARRELAQTNVGGRTIETIAHSAGFAHPQYFSRRFREAYGMTPKQWREQHATDTL